jgi:hypothetical protein
LLWDLVARREPLGDFELLDGLLVPPEPPEQTVEVVPGLEGLGLEGQGLEDLERRLV